MALNTIRLVITSDNHLGRYYDRMSPLKLAERRRNLRRGFHAAVEFALNRDVDIFIQAGDLFDTPDPRNVDREFVADALAQLRSAGIPVIGIAGNHDTPKQRTEQGGSLPQGVYARLGGLDLLQGAGVQIRKSVIRELGVTIGALPWSPTLSAGNDPLDQIEWNPDGDIGILLFHYSIEGHVYPAPNEVIVMKASLDKLRNTQLVIGGHVHQHATLRLGHMMVLIPGATELLTFGETGVRGFQFVELSHNGVERLEHIQVQCQPRREISVRTTELRAAGDDLCSAALQRIEANCGQEILLRMHIVGPMTREGYRALDLRRLWEFGVERNFYFDIDTSGLIVEDEFGNRPSGGVRLSQREELAACADALISEADDQAECELLEETKRAILAQYETGEAR